VTLVLRHVAVTDKGLRRATNQDSGYSSPRLIAIADGMGGAAAGDLASATTMNIVRRVDREPGDDPLADLQEAIREANRRLGELAATDPSVDGMGTTLEAMLWDGEKFATAHIGDSRAYRLRDGELTQLNKDHTFVQSLVDEGRLTPDEARVHPHRSLLLRVMLGRPDNQPDLKNLDGEAGDRYLLCSDGLTDMVSDAVIAEGLQADTIEDAAERLVSLALAAGGHDNVTVVIGELVDEEALRDHGSAELAEPRLVGAAADGPERRPPDPKSDLTATIAPPPDPEEVRYSYVAPRRQSWIRRGILAALVLALVLTSAVAVYQWTQRQYFVATSDGKVAIYQGVQAEMPVVALNHVDELTDIKVAKLPPLGRREVSAGIEATSRGDAVATVERLRAMLPPPKHKKKREDDAASEAPVPSPAPSGTTI
jgi:protein phosphatase